MDLWFFIQIIIMTFFGLGDKTVRIWDLNTETPISPVQVCIRQFIINSSSIHLIIYLYIIKGHTNWVQYISWSPNGKTLASGSLDKTVIFKSYLSLMILIIGISVLMWMIYIYVCIYLGEIVGSVDRKIYWWSISGSFTVYNMFGMRTYSFVCVIS